MKINKRAPSLQPNKADLLEMTGIESLHLDDFIVTSFVIERIGTLREIVEDVGSI